jgi:predicted RNA-binding protein with RPS1 domain
MGNMNLNVLEEIKTDLFKLEKQKMKKGGFERGELKPELEKIADKHNTNFYTVKNTYYNHVKDKAEMMDIDESIGSFAKQSYGTYCTKENKRPPYMYGDIVEVEVVRILNYGVMVATNNEEKYSGLIHISEVKDSFIDDLHNYFEVGDIFDAKVKLVDKEGKIAFSTKDIKLIKKELKQKLEPIKEMIEKEMPKEIHKEEKKVEKQNDELKDIIKFLNGIVGALSPKAKEKLQHVIDTQGVFKFTVSMLEASKTFENDLGYLFVSEVEKKIGDHL